jgi:hypothetical protein
MFYRYKCVILVLLHKLYASSINPIATLEVTMPTVKWVDCGTCSTTGEIQVWDEEREEYVSITCPTCGGEGGYETDD